MRTAVFGILLSLGVSLGSDAAESPIAAFQKTDEGWVPVSDEIPMPTVSFFLRKKGRMEARPLKKDPNDWKATPPSDTVLERGRHHFLKAVQKAIACDAQGNSVGPLPEPEKVTGVIASYRSRRDEWLIGFRLTGNTCEGPMDPEWVNHWYWIHGDALRPLGTNLWLLQIGDYDGDGSSEALFQTPGEHEMMYRLFYDRFRKKTESFSSDS